MKNLNGRIAALESTIPAAPESREIDHALRERIAAQRLRNAEEFAAVVEEARTGVKRWQRLDEAGQHEYWENAIREAETIIAADGATLDDDIDPAVSPETLAIMRKLRLRIARDTLKEGHERSGVAGGQHEA
jgi:hypothetical protein